MRECCRDRDREPGEIDQAESMSVAGESMRAVIKTVGKIAPGNSAAKIKEKGGELVSVEFKHAAEDDGKG